MAQNEREPPSAGEAAAPEPGGGPLGGGAEATAIDTAIRLGFIGLFAWISIQLLAPFALLGLWAVILAVAVHPVHGRLARLLGGRPAPAAGLLTVTGLAILLGPTAVLALSLVGTVEGIATGLADGTLSIPPPGPGIRDWPLVGPDLHAAWTMASTNLGELLNRHADRLLAAGGSVLGGVAGLGGTVLTFAGAILVAGFLFVPGPRFVEGARAFAERLAAARGRAFVDLAGTTIRNVSRGVIGIALLQAVLGGIGLAVAGVPAAGALTLAALVLGIVQIGPGLVLIPCVIWAWTTMDTVPAALFTAWTVPVTLVDNLLRPLVMARGLETPMLVILAGVIGGTLAYGLIGIFLGPVVLAVFYELMVAWVGAGPGRAAKER